MDQAMLAKQENGYVDNVTMLTRVPFMLYKVEDPNMRSINDEYLSQMNYATWTETKFFKSEQIQEVICTEYPDKAWTIDYYNKEFLLQDIQNTFTKRLAGIKGF